MFCRDIVNDVCEWAYTTTVWEPCLRLKEMTDREQRAKIPLQNDVDKVIQEFNDRRDRAMSNFIVSVF